MFTSDRGRMRQAGHGICCGWFLFFVVFFFFWQCSIITYHSYDYQILYNNQMNARALIGQSAMVYCASKLMGISRVF